MKKAILVVLMVVMIATPCLAQEIEPEGILSIDGTLWQALPIGIQIFPLPQIWTTNDLKFGIYGGKVYLYDLRRESSFYVDILGLGVFYIEGTTAAGGHRRPSYFGLLQSIGIGMVVEIQPYCLFYYHGCNITSVEIRVGILTKTDDNWTPPEVG
ncbi:MAG: hypothetical protein KAS98_07440 [Deltaproteobacteria bacterium]|nr:hypothetical protein [Deltaproteobacteria bacterium]